MAKTTPHACIELSLTVTLTEPEVRAIDALMGYGVEDFLKVFYEKMGTSYMKPNEAGLRALFATLRPQCAQAMARIDDARKAFNKDAQ